jgi:single-strand DNA-binding protein
MATKPKRHSKRRGEAAAAEVLGTEVTKIGNLTRDPELRTASSGVVYATFGLAVEHPLIDGDWSGERTTMFYDCVCFGTLAGNAAPSLRKGMRVIVTGRTEIRGYQTPAGEVRDVVRIVVDAVGPELRWARATVRKQRRSASHTRRQSGNRRRQTPTKAKRS